MSTDGGGTTSERGLTAEQLPELDQRHVRSGMNPNLSVVGDLTTRLFRFVGDRAPRKLERAAPFVGQLHTVGSLLDCVYDRDRLAVGVYQDRQYGWSVGLAVVLRGDWGEVLHDTVVCAVQGLNPFGSGSDAAAAGVTTAAAEQVGPRAVACVDAYRRSAAGDVFTIVVLASSDWMCAELHGNPVDRPSTGGGNRSLDGADQLGEQLSGLVEWAEQINDDWDSYRSSIGVEELRDCDGRPAGYTERYGHAEAALEDLRGQTDAVARAVAGLAVELDQRLAALSSEAEGMLDGLRLPCPDDGTSRRRALDRYRQHAVEAQQLLQQVGHG